MRTLLAYVLIASFAVTAGACRRNSGPSVELVEAQTLHDRLLVELGEDAYLDPQMEQVEALLRSVPKDSTDKAAAGELLSKIASERTRVEEEAAARAVEEPPPDLSAQFEEEEEEEEAQAAAAEPEVDAGTGLEQPTTGMSEADFREKFSGCFETGPRVMVTELGLKDTYQLSSSTRCQARHAAFARIVVIADGGKIVGFAPAPPADAAEGSRQPAAQQQAAPAATAPAAPRGPYQPPPQPQTDPNVTRPESTPPAPGETSEDYDSIKY